MRIFEKMFAILNIAFVFFYIFTFSEGQSFAPSTLSYLFLFFLLMFMNYQLEGLKLQSLIYIIAHLLLVYGEMAEDDATKGMSIGFFIAVCITAMTLVLFFSPSNNVPAKGKYDPGFKDIVIGQKAGERPIKMSIYYPTTKRKGFKIGKNKPNRPFWAPDGDKTVKGMFNKAKFSSSVYSFLRYAEIDADRDAELDEDIKSEALPVMIFSHGIRGHRNICSGLCREFASQGFVVYSIEHNDGTAACTYDEKTNSHNLYMQEDMSDMGLWKERIEHRMEEIKDVLDYIHSKPKDLGEEVKYNLDRVVMVGHGFGGCTALYASYREQNRISH